jgi:hypothetical protein
MPLVARGCVHRTDPQEGCVCARAHAGWMYMSGRTISRGPSVPVYGVTVTLRDVRACVLFLLLLLLWWCAAWKLDGAGGTWSITARGAKLQQG